MISVPECIADLFKRDSVLKNFRVTFPDGEHADICNDKIVRESVKFEEYLASRTPIKFGLCESNVISFQCVCDENIKRMRIHAQIEIDVSSLTAAEQAEYGQTSADVPFPYYVVHYGDFIVSSCELDTTSRLRKIVGTSKALSGSNYTVAMNDACAYDKRKLFYYTYSSTKTALFFNTASYVILQGQGVFNPDAIGGEWVYVDDTVSYTDTSTYIWRFYNKITGNTDQITITFEINYSIETLQSSSNIIFEVANLEYFKAPADYVEDALDAETRFIQFFERKYDVNRTSTSMRQWQDLKTKVHNMFLSVFFIQWYYAANNKTNPVFQNTDDDYATADDYRFAPFDSYLMSNGETVALPNYVQIHVVTPSENADFNAARLTEKFKKYVYTPVTITAFTALSQPITTEKIKIDGSTRYTPAIPIANINVKSSLQDNLEIRGKFGGLGRDGIFREYSILEAFGLLPSEELYPDNDLYPCAETNSMRLRTGEFITAKYDEFVFYYKGIYVSYKDDNNEDAEYQILFDEDDDNPDMPYYKLTSNSLITNGNYTEAQLIELIAPLVAVLRNVKYYTCDISMKALPYVEIGDTLFLRTKNDTIVTPVLTQTITGIQDLRAKIVSR